MYILSLLFQTINTRLLKLPSFVFPVAFVPGMEAAPLTFQRELLQHSTSRTTVCNLKWSQNKVVKALV